MKYLSLHLHTIKSIGDSIVTIDRLINKAKELGLNALSITNHGTMSDVFEFYSKCKEENIKPIIGCEIYVRKSTDNPEAKTRDYEHLVLIAKNNKGYKNLLKIHNYGQLSGFYYKPLVDDWVLKAYGDNIIALSACVGGRIPKMILEAEAADDVETSNEINKNIIATIEEYKSYFDEFYLEVQPGDFKEQKIVNNYLTYYSEATNTPLVVTNDVHYVDAEDYKVHNVHVCANRKGDITKLAYPDKCYYVMTNDDLSSAININNELLNQCLSNIEHIVNQIEDYNIIPDKINMPLYNKLPLGYTEDTYLEKICFEKLDEISIKIKDPAEYATRLLYELDTLRKLNFSGYFLVVKDYIDEARNRNIEVGPGRGSVCGSLVAYLADITKVDPIRFGLLFERFLSEHRTSPPDVDTDFASEGRDEIFNYVVDTYGKENCALVSTFSLRKSKSALKDTGRIYGIDKDTYEYVAKLIPEVYYMDDEDGNTEKKTDLSIEESIEIVDELREYAEQYPEWFEAAIKLSNIPKATSVHAAGTLISPVPLGEYIPLIKSKHDTIDATALNLSDAETAGFIKYDFLSLATLGVNSKIKKMLNIKDVYEFVGDDYDDPKVWDAIGCKHTAGLFQISSSTYRQRMGRLAPRTIEQLAACLALVRGPCIASKADQKYMNIVEGKEEIELIHPIYDRVTAETNGILLYQEQFMQIFVDMGFSMEESYNAMKAAAKKKMDKLRKYEEEFMERAKFHSMDDDVAKRIFKILVDTGLYSFNKSHAIAYAILCYITAFFKVYYTREFLASSLTNAYERKEEVKELIADCRRLGIKFLPVNANISEWDFTLENTSDIRIGFCAVKTFGYNAYIQYRDNRPFTSLEDLLARVVKKDCNRKAIMASIFTGAFSDFVSSKTEAYKEYCTLAKDKEIALDFPVQGSPQGRVSIYSSDQEFEDIFFGAELTTDPINNFEVINVDKLSIGTSFKVMGIYDKIKKHKTKGKQEQMAFFDIRTGDGTLECTIFPRQYEQYKKAIRKNLVCNFILRKQEGDKFIVNCIEVV